MITSFKNKEKQIIRIGLIAIFFTFFIIPFSSHALTPGQILTLQCSEHRIVCDQEVNDGLYSDFEDCFGVNYPECVGVPNDPDIILSGSSNPNTPSSPSNPNTSGSTRFQLKNPLRYDTVQELVTAFIRILIQIGLSIAVLFIVYSGFLFVTATGNPEKLKTAKQTFIWAVVGTAILLGALVIMEVIVNTIKAIKA